MSFKKLLLATAIAAVSNSSFAMQAMDDESLSETTGQDGLTVTIIPPNAGIGGDIVLHDTDGLTGALNSGAIVMDNFLINPVDGTGISLIIDATGDANNNADATDPMLQIAISTPANMVISTGALRVADSNGSAGTAIDNLSATILNNINITLGAMTAVMQLGNEPQGNMIVANTTITNGISIAGFALNDADGTGSINVGNITISDNGLADANLGVNLSIDPDQTGLVITLNTLGDAGGLDILNNDVGLGNTTSIGDVEIIGLQLSGTRITVVGH